MADISTIGRMQGRCRVTGYYKHSRSRFTAGLYISTIGRIQRLLTDYTHSRIRLTVG